MLHPFLFFFFFFNDTATTEIYTLSLHDALPISLGLESLDEFLVGGGADDPVELRPVVADEAHVLDGDVVDEPPFSALEHLRFDRYLGALLGDDLGAHNRVIAVDQFARILDLLAAVEVDLRDIGALEEIGEELHELLSFRRRPLLPVNAERPLGGLVDVEALLGDLPHGLALVGLLQRRIVQDLLDMVGVLLDLLGRRPGHRRRRPAEHDHDRREGRAPCPWHAPSASPSSKAYTDSTGSWPLLARKDVCPRRWHVLRTPVRGPKHQATRRRHHYAEYLVSSDHRIGGPAGPGRRTGAGRRRGQADGRPRQLQVVRAQDPGLEPGRQERAGGIAEDRGRRLHRPSYDGR